MTMKQFLIAAFFTFALATPAFAQMEGLEQRVTLTETEITTLQAEVNALRADVNTNKTLILIQGGNLLDLGERVTTLEGVKIVKILDSLIWDVTSASASGFAAGDFVLAAVCIDEHGSSRTWCLGEFDGNSVEVLSHFRSGTTRAVLGERIRTRP